MTNGRDPARRSSACAPARSWRTLEARRPLALGGRLDRRHERHARGDDPPALLVRRRRLARAACRPRRLRSWPAARRRSARSSPSPTGSSTRCSPPTTTAAYEGRFHAGANPRVKTAERGGGDRRRRARPDRRDHQARQERAQGARAAALRPHLAPARRQQPLRLLRAAHAGRGPAPVRGAQGAHVSAHELALPDRRHGRGDQADRRDRRPGAREYAQGRGLRDRRSTCCRSAAWSTTRRSPTTTRSSRPAPSTTRRQDERRRPAHLRPRRAALPRRLPPRGGVREHAGGDDRRRARLPHPRQGDARAGLARRVRRGGRRRPKPRREDDEGREQQLPKLEQGEAVDDARGRARREGDTSRRGATPRARCWPRWRPPASSSRRRSCARR